MEPTTLVTVPRDSLPSCVSGALRLHRAVPCSPDKSEKMAPFFRIKVMSDYSRLAALKRQVLLVIAGTNLTVEDTV